MTLTATPSRRMFIDGDWADADGSETMPVINPATEETIAEVAKGTEADVDRAVAAARAAFEDWSQTTPGERSTMLWRLTWKAWRWRRCAAMPKCVSWQSASSATI